MQSRVKNKDTKDNMNKLVKLYLPLSMNKTGTKLQISQMTTPHKTDIQFQDSKSPRCHQLKRSVQLKNRVIKINRNKVIISLGEKSKLRYNQNFETLIEDHHYTSVSNNDDLLQLNERQQGRPSSQLATLEKWKYLNKNFRTFGSLTKRNDKQFQNGLNLQKQVRISISRMLQKSTDRESFDYITSFYKKPIQNEMAYKKMKKDSRKFEEMLNVSECRPSTDNKSRFHKTIQPRCRCHKNSIQTQIFRHNNTSYVRKRNPQYSPKIQEKKKPQTSNQPHRTTLTLNIPENWTLQSWNTQSKNLNQHNQGIQKAYPE